MTPALIVAAAFAALVFLGTTVSLLRRARRRRRGLRKAERIIADALTRLARPRLRIVPQQTRNTEQRTGRRHDGQTAATDRHLG